MKRRSEVQHKQVTFISFFILLLLFHLSCNQNTSSAKNIKLTGKWKAVELKNAGPNTWFDTTLNYTLNLGTDNTIAVAAEDNIISATYSITKDSIYVNNITLTDVCCNSEAAILLFHFFDNTIKYEMVGDKLTLLTKETVVLLKR